jgi:DNA-binding SARP family transcriptional activator
MTIEIRLLGSLEVMTDDQSPRLPEGRGRALLAILASNAGQVVSTDRLIDLLWGSTPPATARTKLHGLVSTLRKALGPDRELGVDATLIKTRPPGYVLDIDRDQVDVHRFRRLVRESPELPPAERAAVLEEALQLWRGSAFADFEYEPFTQAEISSLEDLRLTAMEDRVSAELKLGHHASLVHELEVLVAENPFRERMRAHAMLALYRSGNQQKALQLYRDAYNLFTEELGIEPGPELSELELAILMHNPNLGLEQAEVEALNKAPDGPSTWLDETRRTVTVAFVEVTAPATQQPDPEAERTRTRDAHDIVTQTVRRHGGEVTGFIGGITIGVFGVPHAHEDDALRAIRAAVEIKEALASMEDRRDDPLAVRFGVNTGEVVVGHPGWTRADLSGDTVSLAARLQQSAEPGEILIGQKTRQLTAADVTVDPWGEGLDTHAYRSHAFRVVEAVPPRPAQMARSARPLVGRKAELAQIHAAFDSAGRSDHPLRLAISGEPGIGKTRLAVEAATALGAETRVLIGRCLSYGEGISFWPLREIVEEATGGTDPDTIRRMLGPIDDADMIAGQVAGVTGWRDSSARPDQLFPAIRRFFEVLSIERPLTLVFEDFQWAQPAFVDLVEYLTDSVTGHVLLMCLVRPEFLDKHPTWTQTDEGSDHLELGPLPRAEVEELASIHGASRGLTYDQVNRVIDLAEGNPLFVEQLLAALTEDSQLTVPPSIERLLIARLDRLGPAERDLIRAASVLGTRFAMSDLVHLIPVQARPSAFSHLESLIEKELLNRVDEDKIAFRHPLIQLMAYQTITKKSRASLHEQVADLLRSPDEGDPDTLDELLGHHLDRAVRFRHELGASRAEIRNLELRAGEHLYRAGLKAFARLDAVGAEYLLSRAIELLPGDHPQLRAIRRHLAETYQVMGLHDDAEGLLIDLADEVSRDGEEALGHFLRLERTWARIAKGPDPMTLQTIEEQAEDARVAFARIGDEQGLAQVCRVLFHVHLRRGEITEVEKYAYQEIDHGRLSGSPREELAGPLLLAIALELGPRPVGECIARCEEVIHWRDTLNPGVVSTLGYLSAMGGDSEEGRRLSKMAQEILRERVRARRPLGQVLRRAGDVELLAGDLAAGEAKLRGALELNLEMGERDMISQIAATLSRLASVRGEIDEGERLAEMSRRQAPAESVASQASWRGATARTLAIRNNRQGAKQLALQALELAPVEMPNLRAETLIDLGSVFLNAGLRDRASEVIDEAVTLYEQKGNVVGAAQASSIFEHL